jgi:hypothetical protein
MRAAPLIVLTGGVLADGVLSGCAPAAMGPLTAFVDPGKYQYYNCEQLAEPRKRWTEREQELKLLMDKAEHSAGGTFVNVIAYQSDYAVAREELKVIESAARDKNCDKSRPGR